MAKGDYPTGALVVVLREYRYSGGSHEVYEHAKKELKNLMMCLVNFEAAQQGVQSEQMGQDTDPKQNPGEKSEAACPYYTHNALLAWHGNYKYCPECGERLRWSGKETDSQPAPSVR